MFDKNKKLSFYKGTIQNSFTDEVCFTKFNHINKLITIENTKNTYTRHIKRYNLYRAIIPINSIIYSKQIAIMKLEILNKILQYAIDIIFYYNIYCELNNNHTHNSLLIKRVHNEKVL